MNKRKLASGAVSIALAVTMLSTTAFAAAASFTDVDSKHWAAPSITEMADRGVMTGVGNNQFAPDKTLTYAEFITMVVRQFYEDKIVEMEGAWYAPYMAVAESAGILKGTGASAELSIDRYNMAQVMYNVMQDRKRTTSPLTDTSKVADWAAVPAAYRDAVSVCYNMGMLSGVDTKGTFNGVGVMTRAQAAVVMDRLIGDDSHTPSVTPGEIPAGATPITQDIIYENTGAVFEDGKIILYNSGATSGGGDICFRNSGSKTLHFTVTTGNLEYAQSVGVACVDGVEGVLLLHEKQEPNTTKDYSVKLSGTKIMLSVFAGRLADATITNIYLT